MVDGVLTEAGVVPAALDRVAFGAGPGSFTGVRLAASVAQAIAMASNASIVPVSSSAALAAAAFRLQPHLHELAAIMTVVTSRNNAWYVAGFESAASGEMVRAGDDTLIVHDPGSASMQDSEPLPWAANVAAVVGQGAPMLQSALELASWRDAEIHGDVRYDATDVLRLSAAAKASPALEAGLPVYLAADSPWRPVSTA